MTNENNVPQAIAAVMLELSKSGFDEDKKNTQSNYAYVSADQVNRRVQAACANAGLAIIPAVMERETNAEQYRNTVRYTTYVTLLMTLATGADQREFIWAGSGVDYGSEDKALYKAYTSGVKYFLLRTFMIGAGDEVADSEHDAAPARQESPSPPRTNGSSRKPTGKKPGPPPVQVDDMGEPVIADEPQYPTVSTSSKLFKQFHAVGSNWADMLGADWKTAGKELIALTTDGRTTSSKEVRVDEMQAMVERMVEELNEQEAETA